MMNAARRVLVFDSGVGGLSVLDAIAQAGHAFELDYAADNAWLPYGLKSDADLRARVPALLAGVAAQWAPEAIVVACNTASTIALDAVRAVLGVPVVGVVPPIKPAAAFTRTGVIGLLATPATVQRAYTDDLIKRFAVDKKVIRFGSAALVEAAEQKLRGGAVAPSVIGAAIDGLFAAPGGDMIDAVALACTHFPLLTQELEETAPRPVRWLESGAAIARRLAHLLGPMPGGVRMRNAGFTDVLAAEGLEAALSARGFSAMVRIGPAPAFEILPAPT